VPDAGDGGLGVQPVQVGQAEQRFGADDDGEISSELGQRGGVSRAIGAAGARGVGSAGGVGQGSERLVDQSEAQARPGVRLAGPGDRGRDQGADHALPGQDVPQQELGRGGDAFHRVVGAPDGLECLGRIGQLPGDRLAQQAGQVGEVAVCRRFGDQGALAISGMVSSRPVRLSPAAACTIAVRVRSFWLARPALLWPALL
jgi:hypothetical protein